MRILLLVPIHTIYTSSHTKYIYGIPEDQGQASWVSALLELGHKIAVYKYTDSVIIPNSIFQFIISRLDKHFPVFTGRIKRKLQKHYKYNPDNFFKSLRFENLAIAFKPDIVIISGGLTSIYPSSIEKIKKTCKSKIYLFSGVNPKVTFTKVEKQLIEKGIIDTVFENDKAYADNWKKFGVKTEVLPISSVDPKKHHKIKLTKKEQEMYGCEVCFVGSITQDRMKKLGHFTKYNFKFWGDVKPGVKIPFSLKPFYKGEAHGKKMIKIFNASKIVLNFQPHDMSPGGNMRTFEINGSGAFQLADKVDPSFFTDKKELVIFKNLTEGVRQIDYYLKNKKARQEIAKKGFERAHREHTYVKHFKKLFEGKI